MKPSLFLIVTSTVIISNSAFAAKGKSQPVAAVREAITEGFKDPDSAQFSGIFYVKDTEAPGTKSSYVCGWVNAKNSYGAYTGKTRFVAFQGDVKGGPAGMLFGIEEQDKKYPMIGDTEEGQGGGKPTVFEHLMWNKRCVDDHHPKSFTARQS